MRTVFVVLFALLAFSAAPVQSQAQEQPLGRLYVQVDEPNPVIMLLNVQETFRQGIKLKPGTYVVKIDVQGRPTVTKTVQISSGKDVRLKVDFDKAAPEEKPEEAAQDEKREKGSQRIFVKATPEDADIRILNIAPKFEQGMTLEPGKYVVEVRKKGLGEEVRTVTLKKGEDLTLRIDLNAESGDAAEAEKPEAPAAESTGQLFVKTTPDDATVSILDVDRDFKQGISLAPKEYEIEVSRKGYETTTLKVDVAAGKDTRVSISLVSETPVPKDFPPASLPDEERATASAGDSEERLYILPMPADAQVRILNIAPKYEPGIEVGDGKFEVEISHDEYETVVRMVTVPKGEHLAIGLDIRPEEEREQETPQSEEPGEKPLADANKGQLYVEADAVEAEVSFLDLEQPFTQGMELPAGSYRLKIEVPGVGSKEAVAVITAGKASHVKISFAPPVEGQLEAPESGDKAQQMRDLMAAAVNAQTANDLDAALESVNKVLDLSPGLAEALKVRGDVLFAKGQYEQALADYDKAVERAPQDPAAYLARGKVHALLEDTESACWDFWQACAMQHCEAIGAALDEGLCR